MLMVAMVRGDKIHKELEQELHETVRLTQIPTAEEAWALKFLNILFGLWELKVHGMTVSQPYFLSNFKMEFPVFGFLNDRLVTGIIDQIAQLPEFQGEQGPMDIFVGMPRKQKYGISDVKTRVIMALPRDRNSRAAEMQLCIYYRLLSVMIDGLVDMSRLYSERSLHSKVCFSDGFLLEVGNLYSDSGILSFEALQENNCLEVRISVCQ